MLAMFLYLGVIFTTKFLLLSTPSHIYSLLFYSIYNNNDNDNGNGNDNGNANDNDNNNETATCNG